MVAPLLRLMKDSTGDYGKPVGAMALAAVAVSLLSCVLFQLIQTDLVHPSG